jgi:DNA-binding XRE family transcriptional regulator
MRKEERWPMYFAIQEQKNLGLRKSQVARNLGISRNTVIKLWDMTVNEYKNFLDSLETRTKKLEVFETEIVSWLLLKKSIFEQSYILSHFPEHSFFLFIPYFASILSILAALCRL